MLSLPLDVKKINIDEDKIVIEFEKK
jgi:hypothetical protein